MNTENRNNSLTKVKLTANILFSGVGMQERGFINSNLFDLDVLTTSDIDKDAILSYATIHNGLNKEMIDNYDYPSRDEMVADLERMNIGFNPSKGTTYDWKKLARRKSNDIEKYWLACQVSNQLGDISKIDKLPYADLWTISFCCQDISVAGKMKGLAPDSGTRSSLLWENIRLLKDSIDRGESPKYLMFENVKNLVSKKFINDFNELLSVLDELGFNSYWKVLNACECGIPQNRQRVFVISIRKDIDTGNMDFPTPFDNGLRLKDLLQPVNEIEEKYYINTERAKNLIEQLVEKGQLSGNRECCDSTINDPNTRDTCNCITARYDAGIQNQKQIGMAVAEPIQKRLGGMWDGETKHQAGSVWDKNNLAPTLDTAQGGGREPHIIEDNNRPISVGNTTPSGKSQCNEVYSTDGVSQTLCAGTHGYATGYIADMYRIRKLTPIETFKLMGLTREDCEKCMDNGLSNSALYKQSGNGIVTNCVELIAEHLYKAQYDNTYICTDEKVVNFQNPPTT